MDKINLEQQYRENKRSISEIAVLYDCSENKVVYWMQKHGIKRRTISEAIYLKANPNGHPFKFVKPSTPEEYILFGKGIGLYWGEGTKANKHSVRLGNTDPELIKTFMDFLITIYSVDKNKLKFGIQIFTDIDAEHAITHWCEKIQVDRSQFYKPTVTISGSMGTYTKKSLYGVVTLYFNNKVLRDIIVGLLPR